MKTTLFSGAGLAVFWLMTLTFLVARAAAQDYSKPIVYSVSGMDKVETRLDVVYRRDGADEMKTDIYMPPGLAPDARRPAVIFIHGGPLGKNFTPRAKDWGVYRSYGRIMAASGLVGVTFDHRYVSMSVADLETSFADVEALIKFVRENAASYHIDPERIALWGFSGGGLHLSIGLREGNTFVRCLISYYGLLDLTSAAALTGQSPQALERFSPVSFVTREAKDLPPVLIGRAGLDSANINKGVELFVSRMLALNADINVLSQPYGRHGFDIYDDNDQSREVIASTVAFVKDRLGQAARFDVRKARAAAELMTLIDERKIAAAREFVRTSLNAPGDKDVADVLITEPRLTSIGNYLLSSNPAAALDALAWAVDLDPASANARVSLAVAYEKAGRIGEAVAQAKKALDLVDKDAALSEAGKKAVRETAAALIGRHK